MSRQRPEVGVLFDYDSKSTSTASIDKIDRILPWWKPSTRHGTNASSDQTSLDIYWLCNFPEIPPENPPLTNEERINVLLKKSSSSDEIETDCLTRFDASLDIKFADAAIGVVSAAKRALRKTPNQLAAMAIKHFFEPNNHQEYFDEVYGEKYNCYRETEWNAYYSKIVDMAYNLESQLGIPTSVSWAVHYLWCMPNRIKNSQLCFHLLLKLGFIWYNFTLELKYRYAVNKKEIKQVFDLFRNAYMNLASRCGLADEEMAIVIKLLDLVSAALLNRLEDISIDAQVVLSHFVAQHGRSYNQEKHLDVPVIIIALYFHEMALLEIKEGNSNSAVNYLKISFLYQLEKLKYNGKFNLLSWQYLHGVVYDLVRSYGNLPCERHESVLKSVYSFLKEFRTKNCTSLNIVLEFALSSLANALHLTSEESNCKIKDLAQNKGRSFDSPELLAFELHRSVISPLVNSFLAYSTFLYPYYVKNKSDAFLLISKVADSNLKSLYGYKYIANTTFLFVSVQYHCHDSKIIEPLFDSILEKIIMKEATQELLCYVKFIKLFMTVIHVYQQRFESAKALYEEAIKISIENRFLSAFFDCLCDSMESDDADEHYNKILKFMDCCCLRNQMERSLIAVGAGFYRKLSIEENFISVCDYFKNCA